jgi:hypothetical protein
MRLMCHSIWKWYRHALHPAYPFGFIEKARCPESGQSATALTGRALLVQWLHGETSERDAVGGFGWKKNLARGRKLFLIKGIRDLKELHKVSGGSRPHAATVPA